MRRLAILASLVASVLVPAAARAAHPPLYDGWPACDATRTQYCVVSALKNGAPVPSTFTADANLLTDHALRFTFQDSDPLFGPCDVGMPVYDCPANLDPADVYDVVLNVGDIRPRSVQMDGQDATVTTGGDAASGYTISLHVHPAPLGFRTPCAPGACGDDTTHADFSYRGFVTGYADDLTGDPDPVDVVHRSGYWQVTNAQYADGPVYDPDTRTFSVQLANVHLPKVGTTPIAGEYEAYMPPAMLSSYFGIDPATLATTAVAVSGGAAGATASATPYAGGLLLHIGGFHFSSPRLVVRARSAPGAPRRMRARRLTARTARLAFLAPRLRGGLKLRGYRASCRHGSAVRVARGTGSPLVVRGLRGGVAYWCTARAVNARGAGAASPRARIRARPA